MVMSCQPLPELVANGDLCEEPDERGQPVWLAEQLGVVLGENRLLLVSESGPGHHDRRSGG